MPEVTTNVGVVQGIASTSALRPSKAQPAHARDKSFAEAIVVITDTLTTPAMLFSMVRETLLTSRQRSQRARERRLPKLLFKCVLRTVFFERQFGKLRLPILEDLLAAEGCDSVLGYWSKNVPSTNDSFGAPPTRGAPPTSATRG